MIVFVNDKEKEINEGTTLAVLVKEILTQQTKGIAFAVNENVISKEKWNEYKMKQNDKVLVITATRGG